MRPDLDPFERAVAFAIERALARDAALSQAVVRRELEADRQEAQRRTMTIVERTERRGGSAA